MALKDFQSVKAKPGEEDSIVRTWMSFGWELKNKQRVKTSDSQKFTHQDSDGTKHYETTPGVDFFELTFERDPDRPNYKELVELENQYYAPLPSVPSLPSFSKSQPVKMGCLWIILAIILLPTIIGTILVIVLRLTTFKKRTEKWEQQKAEFEKNSASANAAYNDAVKALEEAKKKRADAIAKARTLV